jgi:DNA-directed RNA polymerase I, II, and III subunit RPABC3
MADSLLFEETFTLTALDAQKYDRVSRLSGTSLSGDTGMHVDVNTELYPCAVGDRVNLVLASTLALDGSKEEKAGWRDVGRGVGSLADLYEYVCYGKVYRFEEGEGDGM